MSYHYDATLCL